MAARVYHHLCGKQLRDWAHVEIDDEGEGDQAHKSVTFVSRFHVGNRFPISWSYSKDFTDEEILRDTNLGAKCANMLGRDVYVGSIHI